MWDNSTATILSTSPLKEGVGGRLKFDGAGHLVEGQPGQLGVVFDGPQSDISLALNMQDTYEPRCYHGWWQEGWVGWAVIPNEYSTYQEWGKDVWQKLGEGKNLYDALNYAIQETELYGPESAVQNYRLYSTVTLLARFLGLSTS